MKLWKNKKNKFLETMDKMNNTEQKRWIIQELERISYHIEDGVPPKVRMKDIERLQQIIWWLE